MRTFTVCAFFCPHWFRNITCSSNTRNPQIENFVIHNIYPVKYVLTSPMRENIC